jgi:beta-glucanase (GH16 family)
MDWDETSIKIYLDEALVNTISQGTAVNAVSAWAGEAGLYPFKHGQYFILNLAIGGDNGCEPGTSLDAADFPAELLVDYLRVYQAE